MSAPRDHIVRWRQWAVEQAIKTSPRSDYPDDVTRLAGQLLAWALHESDEIVPPPIDSRSDGRYEVRYLDRPDATFREDGGVVFGRSDTFEGAKTLARACRRSPNVRGVQIVDLQYQPPADE